MQRLLTLFSDTAKYVSVVVIFWLAVHAIDSAALSAVLWILIVYHLFATFYSGSSAFSPAMVVKSNRSRLVGVLLVQSLVGGVALSSFLYYLTIRFNNQLSILGIENAIAVAILYVVPVTIFRSFGGFINALATSWVYRFFRLLLVSSICASSWWLFVKDELSTSGLLSAIILGTSFGALLIVLTSWILSGWSIQFDTNAFLRSIRENQADFGWRVAWYLFDFAGLILIGIFLDTNYFMYAAVAMMFIIPVRYLSLLLVNVKLGDRSPKAVFGMVDKAIGALRFTFVSSLMLSILLLGGGYVMIRYVWSIELIPAYFTMLILLPGAFMTGATHAVLTANFVTNSRQFCQNMLWISLLVQILGYTILMPEFGIWGYGLSYTISSLLLMITILNRIFKDIGVSSASLFKFSRDDLIDYLY
ncbi:hypothetical protein ACFLQV_00575 [Calditrichota bacterium]